MFEQILSKQAKDDLALLGAVKILPKGTYLAGGTALALQLGHRLSYDLDFFTAQPFRETMVVQRISKSISSFKTEHVEWRTILGWIRKTKFSLFFYEYPLLFDVHKFLGIEAADVRDIAPMKVAAIADRGTKRDFVDLYFIIVKKNILTLEECLALYDKKFQLLPQNKLHILKSLTYFDDAETGGELKMLEPADWKAVKIFFQKEVLALSKKML